MPPPTDPRRHRRSGSRRPIPPWTAARAVLAGVAALLVPAPVPATGGVLGAQTSPSGDDAPQPAGAARSPAVRILRARPAGDALVLDGRLSEAGWDAADVGTDFVQIEPTPGVAPSERTEARVLYDHEALWVGIRAHDSEPDAIVRQLARRDSDPYSDWVWVGIDSYHDRRTGFVFGVNAAGVERDVRYSDDDADDDTWDAVWDAAVTVDRDGWSAELRIPFSQLRFSRPEGEGATWGVQFSRKIARKRETVLWSPLEEESGAFVSRFGELRGVDVSDPPRRVEIMPYMVARLTRAPGAEADPFHEASRWAGDVGADVKVGLGSALTLTGTVNPDFGQVEADPSVVNLTAFETYFSEKRPFFVEGSEAFSFLGPNLFYSRRIGRAPQGRVPAEAAYSDPPEAATILGAAKLSGKTDDGWTLGVVEAVTASENAPWVNGAGTPHSSRVDPLTSYAALRARKDLRRGRTTVGAMATATNRRLEGDRLGFLHEAAYVAGLDWRHRFGDERYSFLGSLSGSHVLGSPDAIARTQRSPGHYFQRPDADHLALEPGRASLTGGKAFARLRKIAGGHWRWSVAGAHTDPEYEVNDLGFHFDNDRVWQSSSLLYVELSAPDPLQSWSAELSTFGIWTTAGERIDVNGTAQADVLFRNGWGGGVWGMLHRGGVDPSVLRGGPALLEPGRWMARVSFHSDRRKPVSAAGLLYLEGEDGTDGSAATAHAGITVRPSARVRMTAGPMLRWNTDPAHYVTTRTVAGEPHYVVARLDQRTASLDLRGAFTFTPDLSLELWLQPFVSAGRYGPFAAMADARAGAFAERYRPYGPSEIETRTDAGGRRTHTIAPEGAPVGDAFAVAPDFNLKQLRSNAVLRWEYRPGSTLFLAWSQDRSAFHPDGRFRPIRDLERLLDARTRNVFLVKLSHWLGS